MSLLSVAQIKVAVLDTGLDYNMSKYVPLCESGHIWNYRDNVPSKHGTNISGLINNHATNSNYCQIILQVFHKNRKNSINEGLKQAIKLKVDVINLSLGGVEPIEEEKQLILKALNLGIIIVASSGNEGMILSKKSCKYYPACYDSRIVVVGGTNHKANGGEVLDYVEDSVDSTALGVTLSGTSQATAIRTGKIIKELEAKRVSK